MFLAKKSTLTLAALSTACMITTSEAQFVRQEVISFTSASVSVEEFLTGAQGSSILLACHLRLAKAGPKQPVVLLMHGAGGVGASNGVIGEWSRVLNEAGISTCALDSYSGRGINTLVQAQGLHVLSRVRDAFAAREMLAKHPLIDADRIAVMGFSHGSGAAMNSNVERFQKMYESAKFAAHISVYGLCAWRYREDERLTSPLLLLHGSADDWVPAAPCREYASRMKAAGKDVRMIEYADAHHAFDGPASGPVKMLENVSTASACRMQEADGGIMVNADTSKPLGAEDACRKKGVSIGYNAEATKKAHGDAIAFLQEVFK